jgi:hypothetical protein
MIRHSLKTLSTSTPTLLSPAGTHSGVDITIQNVDASAYVYLGGEEVSSTNYGYRISPGHAISIELQGKDSLYAVSSTNSINAAVLMANLEAGQ